MIDAVFIFGLMNVAFEEEGAHWVEILLDGDLKLRFPLRVTKIQAPPDGMA